MKKNEAGNCCAWREECIEKTIFQQKPERVKGINMWISGKGGFKKEKTWSEKRVVLEFSAMFEDSMETSVAGMRLREVGNEVT